MLALRLCSALVLLLQFSSGSEEVPLKIIWNVKTGGRYGCEQRYGVPLDVGKYGILENTDGPNKFNGWRGNVITSLYQTDGKWPYRLVPKNEDKSLPEDKNGALPQLGDLDAHLAEVERIINEAVPDTEFSGQGMLDFEEWFTIWDMNFKGKKEELYKNMSIDLAKQQHPELAPSDPQILQIAKEDFTQAARAYFEETVKLANRLRPKATWGYYIYPKCYNLKKRDGKPCAPAAYQYIKELEWLAKASTAMYPSGYMFKNDDMSKHRDRIYGQIRITQELVNNIGEPHKPIYIYIRINIEDYPLPHPYYSDEDLMASIGMAADLGVNGIIIWGNGRHGNDTTQCQREKDYVDTKLGPYAQRILDFFNNCSTDMCSSNGRCVKHDDEVELDPAKVDSTLDNDHVYSLEYVQASYSCSCYEGWTGDDCSQAE